MGWWIRDLERFPHFIWCALPGAICWGLWKERNYWIFEDKYKSQTELVMLINKFLFDWVSVWADLEEIEWYSIWCENLLLPEVCFYCSFLFFLVLVLGDLVLFVSFCSWIKPSFYLTKWRRRRRERETAERQRTKTAYKGPRTTMTP